MELRDRDIDSDFISEIEEISGGNSLITEFESGYAVDFALGDYEIDRLNTDGLHLPPTQKNGLNNSSAVVYDGVVVDFRLRLPTPDNRGEFTRRILGLEWPLKVYSRTMTGEAIHVFPQSGVTKGDFVEITELICEIYEEITKYE